MKITSNQINQMVGHLNASKTNQERTQRAAELAYFVRCMRDEADQRDARRARREIIFFSIVWAVVAVMVVAVGIFS